MIQIIIIISVIILLVSLIVKWPKLGFYIFKTACLMLLVSGLFFALFFTLMGCEQALNVALHPWEYVSGRFIIALGWTVILLCISQIPFKMSRCDKMKILKIEGLIYGALLMAGTSVLWLNISDRRYPENQIIDKIEAFYNHHGRYPGNLSDINISTENDSLFATDDVHLDYSCYKNTYKLSVSYEYGSLIYDSRKERWSKLSDGSSVGN